MGVRTRRRGVPRGRRHRTAFYGGFLELLGLDGELPDQLDAPRWPEMKERVTVRVGDVPGRMGGPVAGGA